MPSPTRMTTPPAAAALPLRPIPGGYGLPVLGPLKDRLDYFWFQGPETFFRRRMTSHGSTVFRANLPPTFPFFLGVDPRAIVLLDTSSFSSLFDLSVVEKKDVLVGDYMPSTAFTGKTRVGVYQDPSEPGHARVKSFCIDLLKRSSRSWAPEFLAHSDAMLATMEGELGKKGKASVLIPLQKCLFGFLCKSLVGADPKSSSSSSKEIADSGHIMLDKWLALQLLPTVKVDAIPQPLGEILLHSFPFPFFLVSGSYRKLVEFVRREGRAAIQLASEHGIGEDEAIHNILFVLGFNAFGGFSIFFPSLLKTLGKDNNRALQLRLRDEVRRVLAGGKRAIGFDTVAEMELVRSTVYEVLRLKPPVPLQYARAKKDFTMRSHESSFQVKKGELLCGYQPLAMRDPVAFEKPEEFVPDRFMGDEGRELLSRVFWSNGPETETPSAGNKQCAAKEHVVATACMMVAQIFSRYDTFLCDDVSGAIVEMRPAATAAASAVALAQ